MSTSSPPPTQSQLQDIEATLRAREEELRQREAKLRAWEAQLAAAESKAGAAAQAPTPTPDDAPAVEPQDDAADAPGPTATLVPGEAPPAIEAGPVSSLAAAEQELNAGDGSVAETPEGQEADASAAAVMSVADSALVGDAAPDAAQEPLPASPPLLQAVRARIAVFIKIEALEKERRALRGTPELPDHVRDEFERQDRELRRLPNAQAVRNALAEHPQRLEALQARAQAGEVPPLHPLYLQAQALARRQWELILEREDLTQAALDAAWPLVQQEPLFAALSQGKRSPRALFGWAVYALTVRDFKRHAAGQLKELLAQLAGGRKRGDEANRLQAGADQLTCVVAAADRELLAIEDTMVKEFWAQYEEAAVLLTGGAAAAHQAPLRALLRWGMLGGPPWFLPEALAQHLRGALAQPIPTWDASCDATHVFYADEYLQRVVKGVITPSIDEELELNKRGSPPWKQDKNWRRTVFGKAREAMLEETYNRLEARIKALAQENEAIEKKIAGLKRDAPDYLRVRNTSKEKIQDNKIEAARLTRVAERLRDRMIPEEKVWNKEAAEKLGACGGAPTLEELARRETKQIHRVCRLTARLKDNFLPFVLRDSYKPEAGSVNDRDTIHAEFARIQKSDATIFKETLNAAKKQSQRVHMRQSPYLLLTPACGFLAFSWNPRGASEVGRLVIPLYSPRPGLLQGMLTNLCADFVWDTSRESAGVDLLTSDTLVAAYATIRWNSRKHPVHMRERAGIYSKESDRNNWRRHYALFLASAHEAGKKLFFKCPEVYEAVVKYLGLPDGVEKLRK